MNRIDEIRKREQAAAPGPWDLWLGTIDPFEGGSVPASLGRENLKAGLFRNPPSSDEDDDTVYVGEVEPFTISDCAFISGARDDVPFLLSVNADLLEACEAALELYYPSTRVASAKC
jgi:hypothetical protein